MLRHLVLIPTELERLIIGPAIAARLGAAAGPEPAATVRVELCGFGIAVAAARAAALVATLAPARVLLVGIAGRMDDRLPVGSAWRFGRVACHGIGAGAGAGFQPAGSLGWRQWPGDPPDDAAAIGDVLPCAAAVGGPPAESAADLLLTACAASATVADVRDRLAAFPAAAAEDMEGFGVAAACRLAGVPLDIVRGISNAAGDRDPARWRVTAALEAAADLAVRLVEEAV